MEALGIDLTWFILQALNFGLLFFFLHRILHKPMLKLIDQRRREHEESVKLAADLKEEAARAEAKQEEVLEKARREARGIIEMTRSQAGEMEKRLKAEAQAQANQLLERAKADLAQERRRLREEMQGEMVDLVIAATGKLIATTPAGSQRQEVEEALAAVRR